MTDKETNMDMHEEEGNVSPCNKVYHGSNVKYYRKMRGFTQDYLAGLLNMAQPRFSELEKQAVIDDETLEKIAGALDVDIECLKSETPPPATTNIIQTGAKSVVNTGRDYESNDSKIVHNPVDTEKIEKAYILIIDQQKNVIDSQAELIRTLHEKIDKLTDRIVIYADKIEAYALSKNK